VYKILQGKRFQALKTLQKEGGRMRPKKPPIITERQGKLFKVELKRIIDRHHPLVKLSEVVDWEHLDQVFRVTYHPEVGKPACA